jgi:putative sterol carrier protein
VAIPLDRIVTAMKIFTFFANRNSEVKSMLEDIQSNIFVEVKDGTSFYARIDGGKISIEDGKPENSDATIKASRESLRKIISGKLSQEDAFNKKIIESSGSIMDAMRFRRVLNLATEKSAGVKFLRSTLGRFM